MACTFFLGTSDPKEVWCYQEWNDDSTHYEEIGMAFCQIGISNADRAWIELFSERDQSWYTLKEAVAAAIESTMEA